MTKLTIIALFLLAATLRPGQAFCQSAETANIQQLKSTLGISYEKASKLMAALQFNKAEIKAITQNAALMPNEKHNQIMLLLQERQRHIYATLTPDELEKFKNIANRQARDKRKQFEDALAQRKQVERSKEPIKKQ